MFWATSTALARILEVLSGFLKKAGALEVRVRDSASCKTLVDSVTYKSSIQPFKRGFQKTAKHLNHNRAVWEQTPTVEEGSCFLNCITVWYLVSLHVKNANLLTDNHCKCICFY